MEKSGFPSAVLFDFDGTLADSYPAIAASVNHLRALHGLKAISVDEVRRFVGRGPDYLLGNTVPGADLEECLSEYRAHHPSVMKELTVLLPGAVELLDQLTEQKIPVGLVSNKPRKFSPDLLESLGIRRHFQVILGPEDVPRPKPAPDMLVEACKRLDISAREALFVGDMSVDVETARGAGATVWVIPTGSESRDQLKQARPDVLLDDLHDAVSRLFQE